MTENSDTAAAVPEGFVPAEQVQRVARYTELLLQRRGDPLAEAENRGVIRGALRGIADSCTPVSLAAAADVLASYATEGIPALGPDPAPPPRRAILGRFAPPGPGPAGDC